MKVIQIGFNKCGTRTLHQFFESNGVPGIHWENGELALGILRNVLDGAPPLSGFEAYVCFFDMEALTDKFFIDAYKLFPIFHQHYPDAVFILNTRSRDAWLRSRLDHYWGRYARLHMRLLGIESKEELCEIWKRDWDDHHARVREYFSGRGRMIEFHIERDGPEKLAEAIPELALDPGRYQPFGGTDRRVLGYWRSVAERRLRLRT